MPNQTTKERAAPCFEDGVPIRSARICGAITSLKKAPGPNQPLVTEYHVDQGQCQARRRGTRGLACPVGIGPDGRRVH